MDKLIALCGIFSCTLDELLRKNLTEKENTYSAGRIVRVPAFRMARYVMITPSPEDDVNAYMDAWANRSGLMSFPGYTPKRIGWDFPFVSPEQQNRFGLRGYVAAYVLPEGFSSDLPGVETARQAEADYALITIRDPSARPLKRYRGGINGRWIIWAPTALRKI